MKYITLELLTSFATKLSDRITELFVKKESGKGLSTNDYTAADKTKLSGIATGANKYTHPSYTAKTAGLYKVTVDATGHVSAATAVAKADITALGIPGSDTNTTYSPMAGATSSAAGTGGLVPAPAAGKQTSYLRGDGTWVVPTNTTYSAMTGATASAAGKAGLVPAPAAGKQTSYLRGDGTWGSPSGYTHPNSGVTAGTYRSVTVNAQGHVTAGTSPTTLAGYGITDAAAKTHTHTASQITDLQTATEAEIDAIIAGTFTS